MTDPTRKTRPSFEEVWDGVFSAFSDVVTANREANIVRAEHERNLQTHLDECRRELRDTQAQLKQAEQR